MCIRDRKGIEETKEICLHADGVVRGVYQGREKVLNPSGLVSMNFWGFPLTFLPILKQGFVEFLDQYGRPGGKEEYLLPILEMCIRDRSDVADAAARKAG